MCFGLQVSEMLKDAKEVFETIRVLYDFKNLTELSNYFGKNGNWAAQMAKKGSIPFPQCLQACDEKQVSMDWILYGKYRPFLDKKALINEVKEGLYESHELGIIPELNADKLISTSAIIVSRIEKMQH